MTSKRCTSPLFVACLVFAFAGSASGSTSCSESNKAAWLAEHPAGQIYPFKEPLFLPSPHDLAEGVQELAYQITNFSDQEITLQIAGSFFAVEPLPDYSIGPHDDHYFRLFSKEYATIKPPQLGQVTCVGIESISIDVHEHIEAKR